MTEDDESKMLMDEILDGPGDLYYPFSDLRLHEFPEQLRITRELQGAVATTMEDPRLLSGAKACTGIALCLWAVQELEIELVMLRRERSSGQPR